MALQWHLSGFQLVDFTQFCLQFRSNLLRIWGLRLAGAGFEFLASLVDQLVSLKPFALVFLLGLKLTLLCGAGGLLSSIYVLQSVRL
jgi:hypothetical protein